MNPDRIAQEIGRMAGPENVLVNEPMKFHTSFRVGGPADVLVSPRDTEEFVDIVRYCRGNGIQFFVMGKGTNLVVRDGGIRGVVIKTCDGLNRFWVNAGGMVEAEAGAHLRKIAAAAYENALAGFEFAAGIPGTLGGAVIMNAGAYGREMKDVVVETMCLDDRGDMITLAGKRHGFEYRGSLMKKKGYIVLKSVIKLVHGEKAKISRIMSELAKKRREKQPLGLPSAGSIFKRPDGYFAGKLIEECGLKGTIVGGAQVSEKHCGFIINRGNATATDIIKLIEHIRNEIVNKFGVDLQPEVRIVGEDPTA